MRGGFSATDMWTMPTRKPPTDGDEGYLTPEEFERFGRALLGGWGWQRKWCRGTGMAPSTVNRYLTGQYPVPKHVAMLVKCLVMLHGAGIPLPSEFFEDGRGDDPAFTVEGGRDT